MSRKGMSSHSVGRYRDENNDRDPRGRRSKKNDAREVLRQQHDLMKGRSRDVFVYRRKRIAESKRVTLISSRMFRALAMITHTFITNQTVLLKQIKTKR